MQTIFHKFSSRIVIKKTICRYFLGVQRSIHHAKHCECFKISFQCNVGTKGTYRNDVMMSRWHHCPGRDLLPLHRAGLGQRSRQDIVAASHSLIDPLCCFILRRPARGSQYPIDDHDDGRNSWLGGIAGICNYARRADAFHAVDASFWDVRARLRHCTRVICADCIRDRRGTISCHDYWAIKSLSFAEDRSTMGTGRTLLSSSSLL